MTYTDSTLDQIDRAAERRVRDAEWRTTKPTKHLDLVRANLAEYLATPASFPIVVAKPDAQMQDRLDAADAKARGRRFDDVAKVSAFSELA